MLANLLKVAGVNHVITIDLHASQMQGFFQCPVDNLVAEPTIAKWIKQNVPDWKKGVVVSKNPGGTKRVTSLADALKLSFGIVTTDRRRINPTDYSVAGSVVFDRLAHGTRSDEEPGFAEEDVSIRLPGGLPSSLFSTDGAADQEEAPPRQPRQRKRTISNLRRSKEGNDYPSSPLAKSTLPNDSPSPSPNRLARISTAPSASISHHEDASEEFIDEVSGTGANSSDNNSVIDNEQRAKDVIHGRLVHGHIVDEDFPSPAFSARSTAHSTAHNTTTHSSDSSEADAQDMTASFMSTTSSFKRFGGDGENEHALGGSADAAASSDDEEEQLKDPELETTVTLVGNVKDRPVFIVDDMIDKSASWIAAAETVVKRGGATKVFCIATHGLFGGDCLEEMEACECIDGIVVTNSFPVDPVKRESAKKLTMLDVSGLLSEAIRRNHNGESISNLFMHYE
jgi:ribose-phosphate pyrophosphokinase